LGAGDRALARRTVSDGLVLTLLGTLVVSVIGYFNIGPLFGLMGASGRVLDLVREYMQIWFLGAVFAVIPPVSDGCMRATGDMIRPLMVMCTAAGLNLMLDPMFIFGWDRLGIPAMGMAGAAYATLIARIAGAILTLSFLHFHARLIDWSRPKFRALILSWKEIIRLGIPASLNQALVPISQGVFTRLAVGAGGVQAVAAVTTAGRIEGLLFLVSMAYCTALVPLVGQNFGAGEMGRVAETRRVSNRLAIYYSAVCLVLLIFGAAPFCAVFSDDPEVIRLAVMYLLITLLGHVGMHVTTWTSLMINTIGRPYEVTQINLCRVFLFLVPFTVLGVRFFGFAGLAGGIALGNLASGGLAYWIGRRHLR
jgi:putative MATE family efflux protein